MKNKTGMKTALIALAFGLILNTAANAAPTDFRNIQCTTNIVRKGAKSTIDNKTVAFMGILANDGEIRFEEAPLIVKYSSELVVSQTQIGRLTLSMEVEVWGDTKDQEQYRDIGLGQMFLDVPTVNHPVKASFTFSPADKNQFISSAEVECSLKQ